MCSTFCTPDEKLQKSSIYKLVIFLDEKLRFVWVYSDIRIRGSNGVDCINSLEPTDSPIAYVHCTSPGLGIHCSRGSPTAIWFPWGRRLHYPPVRGPLVDHSQV